MYVCMYVYIYIYMCVCVCMYVCMYVYIYALWRSTFNVFSMVVAVLYDLFLVLDFELLFSNVLCGLG